MTSRPRSATSATCPRLGAARRHEEGPFGKFAIDVDNDFIPYYVVDADKRKKVAELKRYLRTPTSSISPPMRTARARAIAWHLLETLKPRIPVKRMVFHEITPGDHPGPTRPAISTSRLVDAQGDPADSRSAVRI